MDNPKSEIYNKLLEIGDVEVFQERPQEIVVQDDLNVITFSMNMNVPNYDLDKDIEKQDVQIKIDIYAMDSSTSGSLLAEVEEKMRELDYLCSMSRDVPDPKGYSHITTTFNF